MKTNLILELKKVVSYYKNLKEKQEMGFSITLSEIENRPINNKVKKIVRYNDKRNL